MPDNTARQPVAGGSDGASTRTARPLSSARRPTRTDLEAQGLKAIAELGHGATGVVHQARERDLQRDVAIKIMDVSLAGDDTNTEEFIEEARLSAALEHPNILPVHRLGSREDGRPYFTMRLVEGRTLLDWIAEEKKRRTGTEVSPGLLVAFLKICDAVSYAHSRGVLHCDLKPANVMVGQHGAVYLVDWGVARLSPNAPDDAPQLTPPDPGDDGLKGTPAFMSPEQARCEFDTLDERSDVFGLGAILFFVLTGRPPYEARTMMAVLRSAQEGKVAWPDPEEGPEQIPAGLLPLLESALAADPEARPQSAADLKSEVEAYLRGELRAPERNYAAGEFIVTEGDIGREAFVIVKGRCVVTHSSGQEEQVVRELCAGDVFGELAVFTDGYRVATVRAIEDVTVRVVTEDVLVESLGLNTWLGSFIKALAERFRELEEERRA